MLKLHLRLYKNNNLVLDKINIPYEKKENTITFYMDNIKHSIYLLDNEITFERENAEYKFSLNISLSESKCLYYLNEIENYVDILVEDATYKYSNNELNIFYQLESDDEFTRLEIIF